MANVMVVDDAYSELKAMESILRSAPRSTSSSSETKEVFVRLIVSLTVYGAGLEPTEARL